MLVSISIVKSGLKIVDEALRHVVLGEIVIATLKSMRLGNDGATLLS